MLPNTFASDSDIERAGLVLGISALAELSRQNLQERINVKVALPDDLLKLIELASEGSEPQQKFLHAIVGEFAEERIDVSPDELSGSLRAAYIALRETGNLMIITDDDMEDEVSIELEESFNEERYFISLNPPDNSPPDNSPLDNFVKKYYLKVISWAKKTGALLVERTSFVFRKLGHFMATLQIPDRVNETMNIKVTYVSRLFTFKVDRGTKWFIATVSGTDGLLHPLLATPALLITFMDP